MHVVIRSAFFCFPAPFRVLGSASRSCTFRRALYAETGNIFARWFGVTFGRLGFFFFASVLGGNERTWDKSRNKSSELLTGDVQTCC